MRVLSPLFEKQDDTEGITVNDLEFEECPKEHAVSFVRKYHSRLPKCQAGPWMFSFRAKYKNTTVAIALWNNPSARTLPSDWLELRRLACSQDAPFNTCSKFISWMVRFFKKKGFKKLISYQDSSVHLGTIYKASNWKIDFIGNERSRDRTKPRTNTRRLYRSSINGKSADVSKKIRWAIDL